MLDRRIAAETADQARIATRGVERRRYVGQCDAGGAAQ